MPTSSRPLLPEIVTWRVQKPSLHALSIAGVGSASKEAHRTRMTMAAVVQGVWPSWRERTILCCETTWRGDRSATRLAEACLCPEYSGNGHRTDWCTNNSAREESR